MVENYANYAKPGAGRERADSILSILLSGLMILGLPALFWISVLEFLNYVFSLGLSGGTKVAFVGVLVGLLAIIWASVLLTAREHTAERKVLGRVLASH